MDFFPQSKHPHKIPPPPVLLRKNRQKLWSCWTWCLRSGISFHSNSLKYASLCYLFQPTPTSVSTSSANPPATFVPWPGPRNSHWQTPVTLGQQHSRAVIPYHPRPPTPRPTSPNPPTPAVSSTITQPRRPPNPNELSRHTASPSAALHSPLQLRMIQLPHPTTPHELRHRHCPKDTPRTRPPNRGSPTLRSPARPRKPPRRWWSPATPTRPLTPRAPRPARPLIGARSHSRPAAADTPPKTPIISTLPSIRARRRWFPPRTHRFMSRKRRPVGGRRLSRHLPTTSRRRSRRKPRRNDRSTCRTWPRPSGWAVCRGPPTATASHWGPSSRSMQASIWPVWKRWRDALVALHRRYRGISSQRRWSRFRRGKNRWRFGAWGVRKTRSRISLRRRDTKAGRPPRRVPLRNRRKWSHGPPGPPGRMGANFPMKPRPEMVGIHRWRPWSRPFWKRSGPKHGRSHRVRPTSAQKTGFRLAKPKSTSWNGNTWAPSRPCSSPPHRPVRTPGTVTATPRGSGCNCGLAEKVWTR